MIDPNEFLTPLDFVLSPFIVAFIFLIALRFRNKNYPKGHPWRPYFIPGLTFKLVGALTIGLIYAYYYKGGDTFNFHYHARVINSALDESFVKWFNILLAIPEKGAGEYYTYTSQLWWYQRGSSYTISAIAAFVSAPFGSLYLPTALVFAAIAYTGLWALFRTFAKLYPSLTRQMAIASLFIPAVALWGSSIFKDTVSMFSLGWLTFGSIQILAFRNYTPRILILTALSFFLAANVKPYIIMAISPPVVFWAATERLSSLKNPQIKIIISFLIFTLLIGLFGIFISTSNELTNAFTLENVAKTSATTRGWIGYVNTLDQGAGYDLGAFEPTLVGMLSKFPQAVNVTFFRPYLWESTKLIVFLNALESLILLVLTIKVISSVGFKKIISSIRNTPAIQFTFFYSIVFAFAVGISSYNFGTLSRYKIPCIPFYLISLILIYYKNKPINRPLWRLIRL
ncbi:MAG: hypothetical protein K9I97_06525 [Cryomorphaceae bacterium]|nr:hypothetical protein [Cryomorphaceae bacterium]